jgi:hypothetical protein
MLDPPVVQKFLRVYLGEAASVHFENRPHFFRHHGLVERLEYGQGPSPRARTRNSP